MGLLFYYMGIFQVAKIGVAIGGRALACALLKLGLAGGLALSIGFLARVFIAEEISEVGPRKFMMPSGSDSGNSGSSSWLKYLDLSPDSGGQGPEKENSEAEPASRKRSADPREDVGPSSVRRRVDSLNPPGAGEMCGPSQPQNIESLSQAEEEELWLKSDEWVLKNLSDLENNLQDEISKLRDKENMRSLAPERVAHILEDLGEKYGLDKLPEILQDIKTKKWDSEYYKETKLLIRKLDSQGYNAKMIRKDWDGK